MRSQYLLAAILSTTMIVVVAILVFMGYVPNGSQTGAEPIIEEQKALADEMDLGANSGTSTDSGQEPATGKLTPFEEGQSLLNSYCTQCHLAQSLEQMGKSRAEWEKALEQMETMGLRMNEAEKAILINYLTDEK